MNAFAPAPSGLKMISLGALLAHPFPDREFLIDPWLRQGEHAMLWAPTGLGKTMLSLTLALAVAGGGEVLGWAAEKPRRVLLVDGEMHAQDLRDRLAMLAGTIAGLDMEAAERNLQVICRQHQGADVRFPDLAEAETEGTRDPGQDVLLRKVRQSGAELVILDNLTTLAGVQDENDAASMAPVVQFLLRLKQAGCGCILVHHSDKGGNNYRGSSAIATTFEVIIGLRRLDDRAMGEGAGFEIGWDKFRGKPTEATRNTEAILEGDPPQWAHRPAASVMLQAMLDAARSGKFTKQNKLAAHLGIPDWKVTRLKDQAIAKRQITREEWSGYFRSDAPRGAVQEDDRIDAEF